MFDHNKLDDYKAAIDDGLYLLDQQDTFHNGMFVQIELFKNDIYGYVINGLAHDTYVVKLHNKDWKTFKKKVSDYFLGVDEK